MKTRILFLMLFVASYSFSQTVNDYKAVVIPMKYDFQKEENQYRLQTITKMNLQKAGFQAFYSNEPILGQFPDRCSLLYVDVLKESGFLTTKLYVVFKDCFGLVIFKSALGTSREKEYGPAYSESLNLAFGTVYELKYQYNGNTNFGPKSSIAPQSMPIPLASTAAVPAVAVPVVPTAAVVAVPAVSTSNNVAKASESKSVGLLYAQPTSYGYQLIDSEPKVVMKVYKTSNPNSYMAKKGDVQGTLFSKDNQWFFEYYQGDNLVSEKIEVKF
ncbi:hypothetical protein C3L50_01790 [Flavobacterium alvei]|uniref:DUF4468 domain-containing protein n=1 Tax=Flavobacterium alvei TaxID=2080416 RepID=A0A2S5AG56_9FLAO|nr:hypothetical protein [Flavobacterium alvei]POY41279.1 hypothetical protein C3L50_01790 [Flavobacterium alvei]